MRQIAICLAAAVAMWAGTGCEGPPPPNSSKTSSEKRPIDSLIADLGNEDAAKSEAAVDQLIRRGKDIVPALLATLKDGDALKCEDAARVLHQTGDASLVPDLVPLLKRHEARGVVASLIESLMNASDVPALVAALNSDDRFTRRFASTALGKIGGPKAIEALAGLLDDKDYRIRRAAVAALAATKDKAAIPHLIRALEDTVLYVSGEAAIGLHSMTNQNFGFKPEAPVADRLAAIEKWKAWLKAQR